MLRVVIPPATEPVTLSEFKLQARIDHNDEDTLIAQYIKAAREHVETILRRALITQTLMLALDDWWVGEQELLMPPLQSVAQITYRDVNGTEHTLNPTDYVVDTVSDPGRIRFAKGVSHPNVELWPYAAVKITYVAGYGNNASDVPEAIRQAVRMLAVHYYENREAVYAERGGSVQVIPFAVDALLAPYRVWSF